DYYCASSDSYTTHVLF
nr:immunoglobulin light chain junction region [Macaca mulatta]MOX29910.1 immunoglobulin light chain junction region [Macaca mulatta]